ncbi:MAG: hypothetical protein ACQESJ_09430 [Bacteroidota bacterium]
METNKYLNISRLYYLMRRDLVINYKSFLIGIAAVGGFLLLLFIGDTYARGYLGYEPIKITFYLFFFFGGFIFTSRVFSELNRGDSSYRYLTLPASTLEKLISKWILSSIAFIIVSYVGIQLITLLGALISTVLFEVEFHVINFAKSDFMLQAARYLVVHSIFFLGACTFRNHNFLKTLLAIFVVGVVVSIFTTGIAYLLPGKSIIVNPEYISELEHLNSSGFLETISQVNEIVKWYVIAPFFLIVSYFKLTERQV